MKKLIAIILFACLLFPTTVFAHSGRTDSQGGHYDRSTGEYHFHHGYSAHQHPNGVCPYDFHDATEHKNSSTSNSSSSNKESYNIIKEENKISEDKSQKEDNTSWIIIVLIIGWPAVGLIYAFIESIKERVEKKRILEQEKLEKEAFLQEIKGKTLRELINIPPYYKMVNGLPVDNNNQLYGSLTVYISKSGTHYHFKKGCCSANTPIHLYRAIGKYVPCSKCSPSHFTIPQWFKDYEELMKKATKYGIEIKE